MMQSNIIIIIQKQSQIHSRCDIMISGCHGDMPYNLMNH